MKSDDELPRGLGRLVVWRSVDDQRGLSVALLELPSAATAEKARAAARTMGVTDVEETATGRETINGIEFDTHLVEFTYRGVDKKRSSITYSYAKGTKGIVIAYTSVSGEGDPRKSIGQAAIRSFHRP